MSPRYFPDADLIEADIPRRTRPVVGRGEEWGKRMAGKGMCVATWADVDDLGPYCAGDAWKTGG